eukprot:COSAG04_NODE_964_length_9140_cov_15.786196_7_plen_107_part_00
MVVLIATMASCGAGPIVNGVLPAAAAATTAFASPISLQWVAAQGDGWIEAMLAMDRASSVPEFREALRPWHSPTFNLSVVSRRHTCSCCGAGGFALLKHPKLNMWS